MKNPRFRCWRCRPCCSRWARAASKSANPLSPTVAGPIAGVNAITAPTAIELNSTKVAVDKHSRSRSLQNAATSGPPAQLCVGGGDRRSSPTRRSARGRGSGDNGRTTLKLPDALAPPDAFHWRGHAEDGANVDRFRRAPISTCCAHRDDHPTPITDQHVRPIPCTRRYFTTAAFGTRRRDHLRHRRSDSDSFANRLAI